MCSRVVYTEVLCCHCSCESEASFGLFLSVFVPFCRCLAERKSTYKRLVRSFPQSVSQVSAAVLRLLPSSSDDATQSVVSAVLSEPLVCL